MSIRSTTLMALVATALVIPVTSFAYWVPNGSEQGGYDVAGTTHMKTRAQVLQELQQAKADPTWTTHQGELTGVWPDKNATPAKTRAQVEQELKNETPMQHAYLQRLYMGG